VYPVLRTKLRLHMWCLAPELQRSIHNNIGCTITAFSQQVEFAIASNVPHNNPFLIAACSFEIGDVKGASRASAFSVSSLFPLWQNALSKLPTFTLFTHLISHHFFRVAQLPTSCHPKPRHSPPHCAHHGPPATRTAPPGVRVSAS